jgi:hypothetical protein
MLHGKHPIGTVGIMCGLPAVPEYFLWSYSQMVQYNSEYLVRPNEFIHYNKTAISYHSSARNGLVSTMLGEWLLMLDTDHQFDPDILARMLKVLQDNPDVDVLSALYLHRGAPHMPVLYQWSDKGLVRVADWMRHEKPYLLPMGSSGAGCLLMRRSALKKVIDHFKCEPFDIIHPYGEDHSFMKRCFELELGLFCAPFIQCHHVTPRALVWPDDHDEEASTKFEPIVFGEENKDKWVVLEDKQSEVHVNGN